MAKMIMIEKTVTLPIEYRRSFVLNFIYPLILVEFLYNNRKAPSSKNQR